MLRLEISFIAGTESATSDDYLDDRFLIYKPLKCPENMVYVGFTLEVNAVKLPEHLGQTDRTFGTSFSLNSITNKIFCNQ